MLCLLYLKIRWLFCYNLKLKLVFIQMNQKPNQEIQVNAVFIIAQNNNTDKTNRKRKKYIELNYAD